MFFWIGFILNIFLIIYSVYKTIKSKNILSPQMFLAISILLYIYMPAVVLKSKYIEDEGYNFVLLVGVLGIFVVNKIFPYNMLLDHLDDKKEYEPIISVCQIGAYIYVAYLFLGIIQAIISAGGIMEVFKVNRLQSFLGGGMLSESSVSMIITEGLKILFYLYFAILFYKRKKIQALLLYVIPMINHRFTAVTRYDFVAMAGALVVFLIDEKLYYQSTDKEKTVEKKRINLLKIGIIGLCVTYFALIFMRLANDTRFGVSSSEIDFSVSSLLKTTVSNDSLYYEYFHSLYTGVKDGLVSYEYGLSWFIYPFMNLIPRSVWPEKPYTAFSARMTNELFWNLDSGNPVVTFSILGEGYAQLGLLGVFISPLIFMMSRWMNFKLLRKMRYSNVYILITMFSLLTYMRSEAPIFLALIDQLWLIVICFSFSYRRRKQKL